MRIDKILKEKQTVSFEFFPPKEIAQESVLFETIAMLEPFQPDFVSITYGAAGNTRSKTLDWTQRLAQENKLNVMMHMTCIASTPEMIDETFDSLKQAGIRNVLALKGDLPKDMPSDFKPHFSYAVNMVEHIHQNYPEFCVGVAGYPEKHPASPDVDRDISYLKAKIDAGASFIVTQLFFDNDMMYRFMDRLEKAGIDVPVLAGIMPVASYSQMQRFTEMCGASLPPKLIEKIQGIKDDEVLKIGVDYTIEQCQELMEHGVNGIHYYTLNKYPSVYRILSRPEPSQEIFP